MNNPITRPPSLRTTLIAAGVMALMLTPPFVEELRHHLQTYQRFEPPALHVHLSQLIYLFWLVLPLLVMGGGLWVASSVKQEPTVLALGDKQCTAIVWGVLYRMRVLLAVGLAMMPAFVLNWSAHVVDTTYHTPPVYYFDNGEMVLRLERPAQPACECPITVVRGMVEATGLVAFATGIVYLSAWIGVLNYFRNDTLVGAIATGFIQLTVLYSVGGMAVGTLWPVLVEAIFSSLRVVLIGAG